MIPQGPSGKSVRVGTGRRGTASSAGTVCDGAGVRVMRTAVGDGVSVGTGEAGTVFVGELGGSCVLVVVDWVQPVIKIVITRNKAAQRTDHLFAAGGFLQMGAG